MKFIATTSNKISTIEKVAGQLIFSRDNRVIYLDTDSNTRTAYYTIITLTTEAHRDSLVSPVAGFYFVAETAILWYYDNSEGWEQLTNTPDNRILFYSSISEFPAQGKEGILYNTLDNIYKWSSLQNTYIKIGSEIWEPII